MMMMLLLLVNFVWLSLFFHGHHHRRAIAFDVKSTTIRRRFSFLSSSSSSSLFSSSSDDNKNDNYNSFEEMQQVLFRREIESSRGNFPWLNTVSSLPFECTSCGKCCRTLGNVYMDPEEIVAAARYLNQTTTEFISAYSSSEIFVDDDDDNIVVDGDEQNNKIPWITIKNKIQDKDGLPSCYFLDNDQCTIYPVRPVQCATYPFWSNIISSKSNWNNEVRRKENDDDDNNEDAAAAAAAVEANPSSILPPWTPEGGGCEGMKKIRVDNHDRTETWLLSSSLSSSESESITLEGIPVEEAMKHLILYERNNRRVPRPKE